MSLLCRVAVTVFVLVGRGTESKAWVFGEYAVPGRLLEKLLSIAVRLS